MENIIFQEVGEEAKACDVFFELLELFKKRFPVVKRRVLLNQKHKSTGAVYRYSYVGEGFCSVLIILQKWLQTQREFLSRNYASKKAAYDAIRAMLMKLNDPETCLLNAKQVDSVTDGSQRRSIGVGLGSFDDSGYSRLAFS